MPDTYTGHISTGRLDVAGNLVINPDSSGSYAATLRTVELNAQTVTASTINVDVFNFATANLDVSGNVVIYQDLEVFGNTTLHNFTLGDNVELTNLTVDGSANIATAGISKASITNLMVDGSANIATAGISKANITNLMVDGSANISTATVGTVGITSATITTATVGPVGITTANISSVNISDGSANLRYLNVGGFSVDSSGNVNVPGTTSVTTLNASGNVALDGNLSVANNVYLGANEYIAGNMYVNKGINVGDGSNNLPGIVLFNGAISTPSGFSVDSSSNLTVPGLSTLDNVDIMDGTANLETLNVGGFSVDSSANVVAPGTLAVSGISTFENNVNITQNISTVNGYADGNFYVNDGVLVGDSSDNEGVKLISSGNTLLVKGGPYYTTDLSGNNISGPFDSSANITVSSSAFNVNATGTMNTGFTLYTSDVVDSSLNVLNVMSLDIDSSSNSLNGMTTVQPSGGDNYYLPMSLNGELYYLRLYK